MRHRTLGIVFTVAIAAAATAHVTTQTPQTFQFFVSASDGKGAPVSDLRVEDVLMSEDGVKDTTAKVEPASIPMKLTIAVDNSAAIADGITELRDGLKGLIEALPQDVEVALIVTAPQPRNMLKPTTDHVQLVKALSAIAPENGSPRFSDALVEFSQRLQKEAKDKNAAPYLPVIVMVSTAATERPSYQPDDILKAERFLADHHAKVNLLMWSAQKGDVKTVAALGTVMQATVARPVVTATNGRYEEAPTPQRLQTLLPDWGRDLGTLAVRQKNQFRVTVERAHGGDLKNPRIELARPGLDGTVTRDGYLP